MLQKLEKWIPERREERTIPIFWNESWLIGSSIMYYSFYQLESKLRTQRLSPGTRTPEPGTLGSRFWGPNLCIRKGISYRNQVPNLKKTLAWCILQYVISYSCFFWETCTSNELQNRTLKSRKLIRSKCDNAKYLIHRFFTRKVFFRDIFKKLLSIQTLEFFVYVSNFLTYTNI